MIGTIGLKLNVTKIPLLILAYSENYFFLLFILQYHLPITSRLSFPLIPFSLSLSLFFSLSLIQSLDHNLTTALSCLQLPHHGTYHQWNPFPEETNRSHDEWGRLTWNEWLSTRSHSDGHCPRVRSLLRLRRVRRSGRGRGSHTKGALGRCSRLALGRRHFDRHSKMQSFYRTAWAVKSGEEYDRQRHQCIGHLWWRWQSDRRRHIQRGMAWSTRRTCRSCTWPPIIVIVTPLYPSRLHAFKVVEMSAESAYGVSSMIGGRSQREDADSISR